MRTPEDVTRAFTPVPGKELSEQQTQGIMLVQNAFLELASTIMIDVPECADRTAALRKLLEAKFTCVQAITHTGYLTIQERKANEEAAKKGSDGAVSGPKVRK
jgi:hypothetical protein